MTGRMTGVYDDQGPDENRVRAEAHERDHRRTRYDARGREGECDVIADDLATLRGTLNKAAFGSESTSDLLDADAALDRVEAELSRLREQRDELAEQGRISAVRYGENFTRRMAAEAEIARLTEELAREMELRVEDEPAAVRRQALRADAAEARERRLRDGLRDRGTCGGGSERPEPIAIPHRNHLRRPRPAGRGRCGEVRVGSGSSLLRRDGPVSGMTGREAPNGDPLDLHVPDAILEAIHRPHEYVPHGLYDEVTKLSEYALRDLLEERRKLIEVARAARDLSGRIVDGPGFDLGEIFNAAGRLDAALARLDGPR